MKSEELKKQAEPVAESEKPELGTDGYKIDASNIGSTTSNKPIFEVAEKPEGESRKNISKETFERLLKNEVHKSLCVMDVGSERHPDYIIAGFDNLVKDMSEILYPAPPEAEPVESAEAISAEQVYNEYLAFHRQEVEISIYKISIEAMKEYASQEKARIIKELEILLNREDGQSRIYSSDGIQEAIDLIKKS